MAKSFFKKLLAGTVTAIIGSTALPASAQDILPKPPEKFQGQVNLTAEESTPDFPGPVKAPEGAPNVLLIVLDDVGFGATGTFGGPVNTPTLDKLASQGLRYNCFHTTALCSPTRAALITGRNHHSAHYGVIGEIATGFEGYNSIIGKDTATIGEILKQNGYSTSWFGKDHNVPDWEMSQAGPFDRYPTGMGFEYFYGFLGAETAQWDPHLTENTRAVEKPAHDKKYHLDKDLADHAINWIKEQKALAPDKPFFAYYCPGTSHAPHHAPKEWIEKYKGHFDQGWDKVREETLARQIKLGIVPENTKLTARPEAIPAWDSLNPKQKELYARMMEVYAGALGHCDYQIGRIIDYIEKNGLMDNTMIIFIAGDNGASAEGTLQGQVNESCVFNGIEEPFDYVYQHINDLGGPMTYNHYPVGWAFAMDSPLQWTKQIASHFGGTRNGMVIAWPGHIRDKGSIRSQFHHVIDIVPTILEATGIKEPYMVNGVYQKPVEGISMVYSFNDEKAPSRRETQYFEMMGNRAIYHDGWIACTTPMTLPWTLTGKKASPRDYKWELYNVKEDFSQASNLSDKYPEKLRELQDMFWVEAAKYNVLPLDNRASERSINSNKPSMTLGKKSFTYYPGIVRVPAGAVPNIKNSSYTITACLEIPEEGVSGMIVNQGDRFGGWGLYVLDSKPVFAYNLLGLKRFIISSDEKLPHGKVTITYDFKYDGGGMGKGGTGTISVNGKKVAEGKIEKTIPFTYALDACFDVGEDRGTPLIENTYEEPFKFTGTLEKVVIELK
ncbi:MAG: arylsulfatase [Candidatus Eremiobacterota bacterium]